MSRWRATSALALSVCLAFAAAAEEPPVLDPVVVEETRFPPDRELDDDSAREAIERTPAGVALVPESKIAETRATSLEDVLEAVPGVYLRGRGFGEEPQISIRGSGLRSNFHTRGVNVLVDGFPFQNADGSSDVESFEFLAAKRVEVYKGASSMRYGGNVLGGALNIVTQTGRDAPPVRLRSEAGAFGFWKSYGSLARASGAWDGFLAFSDSRQDGYRDHARGNRQRVYASVGRALESGAGVRADVNAVQSRSELPGALTREELRADPGQANPASALQDEARDYEFGRVAVALHVPVSEQTAVELHGQVHRQDLWHPLAFGIIENDTTSATVEARVQGARPVLGWPSLATAGAQASWMHQPQEIHDNLAGHQGATVEDQIGRAENAALYFALELALSERVSVVAAARGQLARRELEDQDLVDPFFDTQPDDSDDETWLFATPSLGVIFRVTPEAQVYANAGRIVEAPILLELTAPGNLNGDLSDLDPQRAWQFEVGTRGRAGDRVTWELAAYDVELWDEIRNVNVDPTGLGLFTIPRFENIDRSRHRGLEVGVDLRVLPGLHASAAYTLSYFKYTGDDTFDDNDLPGVPRHFLWTELRYRHPSGFWIAPNLELVPTDWYVDSANTVEADSHAIWSVRLGYDHERSGLGAFLELRNLTDREFVSSVVVDTDDGRFFEPGDGRAVYGGVEWRWR